MTRDMRFDVVTLFPESLQSYLDVSILKRAREAGLISVETTNPRDFTEDKHRTVDDTPYGGGAGMVMKAEPIFRAVNSLKESSPGLSTRTILFSAKGKVFTQKDAKRLLAYDRLILVCGRYEGVDERVAEQVVDEELSIGEYVLTGGELPALIVVDAITRLLPGVLGNEESSVDESHSEEGVLEYPQYTKPEEWRGFRVPEVLLSGHHAEIEKWRRTISNQYSPKRNIKNEEES